MRYIYQYDVAALVVSLTLLCLFIVRSKMISKASKVFFILINFNFIASALDLFKCIAINNSNTFKDSFGYFTFLGSLLLYNLIYIFYFSYIDSKGKIGKLKKAANIITFFLTIYTSVCIFLSPSLHLVAYFDENMKLCYGPLMTSFYVIQVILVIFEIVIFFKARRKFNRYQIATSLTLSLVIIAFLWGDFMHPYVSFRQFVVSLVLLLNYIAYENPSYFTYLDTQCCNRFSFYEVLSHKRREFKDSTIMFIHIKDFNYIRDHIGSRNVNSICIKIANSLHKIFRNNVFCLQDNYYAVFLRNNEIENAKKSIEDFFSNPIKGDNQSFKFNYSIRLLHNIKHINEKDLDLLIEYGKKYQNITNQNRNDILNKIRQEKQKDKELLLAIEKAIKNKSFEVYYQPIYNLKEEKYESAEALIRLFDDNIDYINPEEMIVIAEKNGLIDKIGEIVFEKVCDTIKNKDLERFGIKYIEVNLSPIQLMNRNIVSTYKKIMDKYGVSPSQINLEITETAQIEECEQMRVSIKNFSKLGITFSIDDYGSGFSGVNYLIKLPIKIVKIDKEILWAAMKDDSAMIVLQNTTKMMKQLKYEIVVEGVEDNEMVELLRNENVDFNQGYYFSKPMCEDAFVKFIKDNAILDIEKEA